jgi:CRP/FNR family cyclic AMP-dependent transcriptional regulator
MNIAEAIIKSDLFFDLTQEQAELIASISVERHANLNEVIFSEGSTGRDVFIVVQGMVEVYHDGNESGNDRLVLATLMTGQPFGEIAFVDGAVREASVRSVNDDTVLLAIDAEQLMKRCDDNPAMGYHIVRNIARTLAMIIRETDLHALGGAYWTNVVTSAKDDF